MRPISRPPAASAAIQDRTARHPPSPLRTFTSPDGRTIQAEKIGFPRDQVTLRRADGLLITNDLTLFSAEDSACLIDVKERLALSGKP